jgi:DNA-binding ferritin-like protein
MLNDYILNGFIKAASLNKSAQDSKMDEESCKLMSAYTTFTRAVYLIHQQNHWNAVSYEDHLLFERLYNGASERADEAAERTMGLCGKILFEGKEVEILMKLTSDKESRESLIQSSIDAEKEFIEIANNTMKTLEEKDQSTLGLEDMIPAHVSLSETHLYLLQQNLKGA